MSARSKNGTKMPADKKQSGGIRSFLVNSLVRTVVFMYLKFLWPSVRSCIFWSATTMLLGPRKKMEGGLDWSQLA